MDAREFSAILFLGGLLLVPLSSLAASEWSPAVLAEEAIRGIEAIDIDLADEQAFAIRCSVRVSNRGRSRKSVCLETPDQFEMSREIGGFVRDVVEQFQPSRRGWQAAHVLDRFCRCGLSGERRDETEGQAESRPERRTAWNRRLHGSAAIHVQPRSLVHATARWGGRRAYTCWRRRGAGFVESDRRTLGS